MQIVRHQQKSYFIDGQCSLNVRSKIKMFFFIGFFGCQIGNQSDIDECLVINDYLIDDEIGLGQSERPALIWITRETSYRAVSGATAHQEFLTTL